VNADKQINHLWFRKKV